MTQYITLQLKTILVIIIIISTPCFAESKNEDFILKQRNFISDLYKEEKYFDCITETQRLLNYENDADAQNELLYFINACYYSGGQYKTVISRLRTAENSSKDRFYLANLFLLSNAYYNLGYYDKSKAVLDMLDYADIKKDDQDKLFAGRAEKLLRSHEYSNILSEVEYAGNYINEFNKSFTLRNFRNDIERYREIGLRSKWLSASLSALLPGAGQIYSGRITDGILSFAAVAGTAFGAYYYYNKKEKPPAITLTFFSGLFYCGNIYGAYNSALYKNNELNQKFSDQIIKKYNLKYDPMDFGNFK